MTTRSDDVLDLIARATKADLKSEHRVKIRQMWNGHVAVWTDEVDKLLAAIDGNKNVNWHFLEESIAHGPNWVSFFASYTVKSANANDAEKWVKSRVSAHEIAVQTWSVVPA